MTECNRVFLFSSIRVRLGLLCFCSLLLTPLTASSAETLRWVDEEGRVHYGDTAPEKYRKSAEVVQLEEAPKLGLSEQELRDLKRKTAQYERQTELKRRAEEREKRRQARALQPTPVPTPQAPRYTREQCRDIFPHKTADRVRCFNEAAGDQP